MRDRSAGSDPSAGTGTQKVQVPVAAPAGRHGNAEDGAGHSKRPLSAPGRRSRCASRPGWSPAHTSPPASASPSGLHSGSFTSAAIGAGAGTGRGGTTASPGAAAGPEAVGAAATALVSGGFVFRERSEGPLHRAGAHHSHADDRGRPCRWRAA